MGNDRLENLWVEKYRPKNLDELCISPATKDKIIDWGINIPHLLFVGNVGVGKTTLAKIIVQDILDCDYLYLNASDENGIDTIRVKVTSFIQTKSFNGDLKVVILDEADALTFPAQDALRNLIESYATNARFILTGNHKHKIRKALQSRCRPLSVGASVKQAFNRCLEILKLENIEVSKEQTKALAVLVKNKFPDIRDCINQMQDNCIGGVLNITEKTSTSPVIKIVLDGVLNKTSLKTREYLIKNEEAFNSDHEQLLVDLLNHVYKTEIEDSMKKAMILVIADHLEKCSRVNDKEINFFACLLNLEQLD